MIFEHEFIDLANTAGISNVSTRGQPTTSTFCKKDIKGSIKSAISENPSFKQFLEENNAYGRYVKNVTNQILRSRDISGKLIKCVHRIAHKVTTIGPDYILVLKVNNNNFNLKINFINLSKI